MPGSRCASIPTSTPAPTLTSPQACTSTSSAFRSSRRAALYRKMAMQPGLQPVGIHVHLGSQIISTEPIQRGGGGSGPRWRESCGTRAFSSTTSTSAAASAFPTTGRARRRRPNTPQRFCRSSRRPGLSIALEPGRYIVGAAGALLARVVDLKDAAGGHHFAVLDAGMTELMRPMLYGAFHRIVAVTPRAARDVCYDIVGPVCESTDAFRRRPAAQSARSRRSAGDSRRGRVRIGDVVQLQPPPAAG